MSVDDGDHVIEEGYLAMGEGHQLRDNQNIGNSVMTVMTNSGKHISICPMCNGKGYYEEVAKLEVGNNLKASGSTSEHKTRVLPSIRKEHRSSYKLEQLFKSNNARTLSRVSDSAVPVSSSFRPNTRFPPVHIASSYNTRKACSTTGHVNNSSNNTKVGNYNQCLNLLPTPSKLERQPADVARLAAIKLNRTEWSTKKAGLEECLQLAHFNPDELEPHMSIVYRTISSLLNNFRPQVTIFSCQAAREFFTHMRSTCRPEFDELVYALLNRTADTNRHIRLYANDALDKMITYIPTVPAVRPIVEKGPTHNNPLVRSSTARLLNNVVTLKTPNVILTYPNLRETCKKILEAAALLLADNNLDTRAGAKKLFQGFLNEEDFETVYYAEVDEKLRRRVDRPFIELKYKKHIQEAS